ncbi:alpha/beta hydrolase [Microbacterium sp. NPDC076911]|uniref:alpha/beta hydrolase n=1 Tax=Microbacterium sp. NPDC076911 TaxID=3154958 RepID=UPI003440F157
MSEPDPNENVAKTRRPRGWRVFWWVLASIGALLVAGIIGLVIWSQVGVYQAEPEPLAAVQSNPAVTFTDTGSAIIMAPAEGDSERGLVYIPGAKVEAAAYAFKMSGIVEDEGITVVITKPWLNLAFFDLRPISAFTELAPEVDSWAVGGHSLGGVRACMLAADADALALFGSYCATDLADSELSAISLSGSDDGLSTPEKVNDARSLLPPSATMYEIAGANHASFGDYGPQAGDGIATISDDDMRDEITEWLAAFADQSMN